MNDDSLMPSVFCAPAPASYIPKHEGGGRIGKNEKLSRLFAMF